MKTKYIYLILVWGLMFIATPSQAQEQSDADLLNMSLDELMDIEIVNVSKLNLQNLSEVPSAVTIVTAEQIENSGAKNMEEVMRLVPGFDVIRTGRDPSTNLGVRGLYSTQGTNNKILFLVNDHPIRSMLLNDASVYLGNYPVASIKQIEVIRGPGSTLFGAGAFLGVINIRTKEADSRGEVSGSFGSFNTVDLNGLYTFRAGEDLSVTINGSYHDTDGADATISSDLMRELVEPVATNLGGYTGPAASITPGDVNYGRTTTSVNLKANYKGFFLNAGHMNSEDEIPIGLFEILVDGSAFNNDFTYVEGGFRNKILKDKGEILVKTYFDHFNFDSDVELIPAEGTGVLTTLSGIGYFQAGIPGPNNFYAPGEGLNQRRKASNEIIGTEINFAYNFDSYVNVLVGAMYEKNKLMDTQTTANGNFLLGTPMMIGTNFYIGPEAFGQTLDVSDVYPWLQDNERTILAGFGQADFNLKNIFNLSGFEHLKLVAGVRYDDYSDVGGELNPRLGLLAAPTANIYIKGLFGRAFRAPSFVELYSDNSVTATGNPALNAETVKTYEGVIGYRIDKRFDVNLTYYNTRIENDIQLSQIESPNSIFASQYRNVGEIKTSGVEGQLTYNFANGGYLNASFTVQNVLDISRDSLVALNGITNESFGEIQEEFDPGVAPDLSLGFSGYYPINNVFSIGISINHITERNRTQELAFARDPGTQQPDGSLERFDGRESIPARTIVDASLNIRNLEFLPNLGIQLSGYNILNADNFNPTQIMRNDDLLREGSNWRARLLFNF